MEQVEEYIAEICAIISIIIGLISFIFACVNRHKLTKIKNEIDDEIEPDLTEEQKLVVDEYKLQCYKDNLKKKGKDNG